MAEKNYIGIMGLVTQSLEEIREEIITKFKGIFGQDINIEQNSPDGQLLNLWAQIKKDVLDLFTQLYNMFDPDRAVGVCQTILYKLNGLTRKAYTYSYVYINVTVSESVTLQGLDNNIESADATGYTVRDTNGNRWILATTQNIQTPGTYLLNFRAGDLGSVTALPNTITVMETVLKGVTAVNNPANNYIIGNTGESDAQFRRRRNRAMAVPSQGFDESTESQMLNLDNVIQCKVYDNRSDEIVNGIPAHGIWVIVQGGTPEDIGRVIYNNLPPGIPMKGLQSVLVPKLNGDVVTMYYNVASPTPLYVKATIKNFTTTSLDTDYIKSKLSEIIYEIQQRAESSDINTVIKDTIGSAGAPYNIEISLNGIDWAEYVEPEGLEQYFVISSDTVTLTVVEYDREL